MVNYYKKYLKYKKKYLVLQGGTKGIVGAGRRAEGKIKPKSTVINAKWRSSLGTTTETTQIELAHKMISEILATSPDCLKRYPAMHKPPPEGLLLPERVCIDLGISFADINKMKNPVVIHSKTHKDIYNKIKHTLVTKYIEKGDVSFSFYNIELIQIINDSYNLIKKATEQFRNYYFKLNGFVSEKDNWNILWHPIYYGFQFNNNKIELSEEDKKIDSIYEFKIHFQPDPSHHIEFMYDLIDCLNRPDINSYILAFKTINEYEKDLYDTEHIPMVVIYVVHNLDLKIFNMILKTMMLYFNGLNKNYGSLPIHPRWNKKLIQFDDIELNKNLEGLFYITNSSGMQKKKNSCQFCPSEDMCNKNLGDGVIDEFNCKWRWNNDYIIRTLAVQGHNAEYIYNKLNEFNIMFPCKEPNIDHINLVLEQYGVPATQEATQEVSTQESP
jgi:hypothetical protein